MKKIILVLFFAAVFIFPQNNKGRISFTLDGEKFDLPFNMVELRKADDITITARAEKNDSAGRQQVSIQTTRTKMIGYNRAIKTINIQINSHNNADNSGKELSVSYDIDNPDREQIRFGKSQGGEKVTWEATKISLRIPDDDTVTYSNGVFRIASTFTLDIKADLVNKDKVEAFEIKDAKFEIIF